MVAHFKGKLNLTMQGLSLEFTVLSLPEGALAGFSINMQVNDKDRGFCYVLRGITPFRCFNLLQVCQVATLKHSILEDVRREDLMLRALRH